MAEIEIEKKGSGGSTFWPWVIGIILVILIVAGWLIFEANDNEDDDIDVTETGMVLQPYVKPDTNVGYDYYAYEYLQASAPLPTKL